MRQILPLFCSCLALSLLSCDGGTMTERASPPAAIDSVPQGALDRLRSARLYFGHQSVGHNIIEGITTVFMEQTGQAIHLEESRDLVASPGAVFLHSTIGQNGDPLGKIHDFDTSLRAGRAAPPDIAFMKLCYADILAETDIGVIFQSYRDTLARLKEDFPRTTFVHITTPLLMREKGLKSSLKRILGRQVWGYEDNLNRERFNNLLRSEYEGKEPLFDIAFFESTRPDGTRIVYRSGEERYFGLEQMYTTDGGHLNKTGQVYIAKQLLVFLARSAG